jgi:DNA-binding transcriptional LysR family regulator
MEVHDLGLNLLVALDALMAEKNVTRAGQRIYLSQSATSGVPARLREYFNTHNRMA